MDILSTLAMGVVGGVIVVFALRPHHYRSMRRSWLKEEEARLEIVDDFLTGNSEHFVINRRNKALEQAKNRRDADELKYEAIMNHRRRNP